MQVRYVTCGRFAQAAGVKCEPIYVRTNVERGICAAAHSAARCMHAGESCRAPTAPHLEAVHLDQQLVERHAHVLLVLRVAVAANGVNLRGSQPAGQAPSQAGRQADGAVA